MHDQKLQTQRPTLTDGHVTVRPPKVGDVDARLALGTSAAILRMYGAILPDDAPAYSRKQAQAWYDNLLNDPHGYCIDVEGALIGFLRLHSFREQDKDASIAIGLLDETRLGQGIGTAAMRLILRHAFDTLPLHRVSLRALAYNDRAIAAYRKLGFTEEGRLRESCRVGDVWHDDIQMGLLAREFIQ